MLLALLVVSGAVGAIPPFSNPQPLLPDANGTYVITLSPATAEIDGQYFCLRLYNGLLPGPTIRINDSTIPRKIRVDFHNELQGSAWRQVPGQKGGSCRDFSLSNLHLHGAHVQPNSATYDALDPCNDTASCAPGGRYYGDNVLLTLSPGQYSKHRFDLDEDHKHEAGTNYYHPHVYGSTGIQVVNGAVGAFIVEGPIDADPVIAALTERVMVINEIPYTHSSAKPVASLVSTCDTNTLSIDNFMSITQGMPLMINGETMSMMNATAGSTERWRLIYAGTTDELALKMYPSTSGMCDTWDERVNAATFDMYARDGITMVAFHTAPLMWLSPGSRVDAFVTVPSTPGLYCLVGWRVGDGAGKALIVLEIEALQEGQVLPQRPSGLLLLAYAKPTEWMGTMSGLNQSAGSRLVNCDTTAAIEQHQIVGLRTPPFDSFSLKLKNLISSVPVAFLQPDGGPCTPTNETEVESDLGCECPSSNINCRNYNDRRAWGYRNDRIAIVGQSEKWLLKAFEAQPFHTHINPFLVCPKQLGTGKEPNFPVWRDVLWVQDLDGPRVVLMEHRAFTGKYLMHTNKLTYEEEGMLEIVEICSASDAACLCLNGSTSPCLSNAGCWQNDSNCKFAAAATVAYPDDLVYPACDPAERSGEYLEVIVFCVCLGAVCLFLAAFAKWKHSQGIFVWSAGCLAPRQNKDGSYDPSCCVLQCFAGLAGAKAHFELIENPVENKKILIIGTSKKTLMCANGKAFNTGHNITETFLPMMHMSKAGFKFDFATASGEAFAFEHWSWEGPRHFRCHRELQDFAESFKEQWTNPITTIEALPRVQAGEYSAVYFPGGHGTMINMHHPPDNGATSTILAYLHEHRIPTIALCHGPNVFRAAPYGTYHGYKICAFPDAIDMQSPSVGYLPGPLPELMGHELSLIGITVMNRESDDSVMVHHEVITGAGPRAANALGLLVVKVLLKHEKLDRVRVHKENNLWWCMGKCCCARHDT